MIQAVEIGLLATLVTELLKLIPWVNQTDDRKRTVAFGLAFLLSIGFVASQEEFRGEDFASVFLVAATTAFAVYKTVIQPAVTLAASTGRLAKRAFKKRS